MSLAVLKLDLILKRSLSHRRPQHLLLSRISSGFYKSTRASTTDSSSKDSIILSENSSPALNSSLEDGHSGQSVHSEVEQFVASLTTERRQEILEEIQRVESSELRQRAEGGIPLLDYH